MRLLLVALLAAFPQAGLGAAGGGRATLRIDRGEGQAPLHVPRAEKLVYGVRVKFGLGALRAGTVTLEAGVEPYRSSVLFEANAEEPELETGWIRSTAVGEYGLFEMNSTMEARHLPCSWPQIFLTRRHEGDVEKRRELKIGLLDGQPTSEYRRDTETGAPPGTRIWKQPKQRSVPDHSLDMLSGIYLARTLVAEARESIVFPLVDKTFVWQMELKRGEQRREETPAGSFDVVEILLEPQPHPEEDEKLKAEEQDKFEGLFGLKGAMHLWVDARTGIPIRVVGDLPVGFLDLHIDAVLEQHEGTPEGFGKL